MTSSLRPGYNELWDAVRPQVADLAIVGARSSHNESRADVVALRQVDAGRGLIWQHLVGLKRFMRSFNPDLIHINREVWGVVAQEVIGLDTKVVVHGAENLWHHGSRVEQSLRRRLVDRAVRRLDGYASWNHAGAAHIAARRDALGLPPLPTLVLPAVIPPPPFRRPSWSPSTPVEEGLELLLVGRASTEKGFADAIEAAAQVPRVRVTFCGTGPLLSELQQLAEARSVELLVEGQVRPRRLAEIMARSHLLVQPSRTTTVVAEQFGRSVAEAMTIGLPCLVSDCGELPHLVDHAPQALFPEGDVSQLRDRLTALTSTQALHSLSVAQRRLARRWSPPLAAESLRGLWERVVA